MKFKVGIHKVEHVADMQVEAVDKVAAAQKVQDILDTENGCFILAVDIDSVDPVLSVGAGKKVRIFRYPGDLAGR